MSTLRKENSTTAPAVDPLVKEGQRFYDEQLRHMLEPEHTGRFVAVEPFAGKYFMADTPSPRSNWAAMRCPTAFSSSFASGTERPTR